MQVCTKCKGDINGWKRESKHYGQNTH
jgi:hypothetical protein